MRIAVLGSGNGGCAVAFDHAIKGHDVSLFDFDTFPNNIKAIQQQGGIRAEGELDGFISLEYVGHNIEEALTDIEIIYVVGPAYSTKPFAKVCQPYLKKGQIVIVCPSSCMGSINRFVTGYFADDYKATIGVNVYTKQLFVDNSEANLQIWDVAHQTSFRQFRQRFFSGA
jgi:ketopantoate reductase